MGGSALYGNGRCPSAVDVFLLSTLIKYQTQNLHVNVKLLYGFMYSV